MKTDPTNYDLLAEAIVAQAGKDYLEIKKFLYVTKDCKETKKAEKELKNIEKFFNSRWYKTLTDVNADWLKAKLDEEFEAWKREQN